MSPACFWSMTVPEFNAAWRGWSKANLKPPPNMMSPADLDRLRKLTPDEPRDMD